MNTRRETARIYQFPVKARAAAGAGAPGSTFGVDKRRTPIADVGSGWYHDAAIQREPVSPRAD